jgi:ribonuclease/clavin/mitogillin
MKNNSFYKISYKHTNIYLIKCNTGFLSFDVGWPGTKHEYKGALKEVGLTLSDIKYFMVSHFHIDHAGLAGDFLNNKVEAIIFENQIEAILPMEELIHRKKMNYIPIDRNIITPYSLTSSKKLLNNLGINGIVLLTQSHSFDSVSLVLSNGIACTGDLAPEKQMMNDNIIGRDNWKTLKSHGALFIKPSHGNEFNCIEE